MQLFEFVDADGLVVLPRVQEALDPRGVLARPIATDELVQAARQVQIHPARVGQVSLDEPLRAVPLQCGASLLDRHHRLAQAALKGRRTVDVRVLGEADGAGVLLSDPQVRAHQLAGCSPPDLLLERATRLDSVRIAPPLDEAVLSRLATLAAQVGDSRLPAEQDILAPGAP